MTEQHALVWEGGTVVAVRGVPVPASRTGWAAVDVAYAGICGSDLHVAAGEHSRAQPGTILGHEFVGRLAEPYGDLPAGQPVFGNPMVHCGACEACLAGRTNTCRNLTAVGVDYPGAIAPRTVVPGYGIYPLPQDVDLAAAALIEPVAVAVRAVRRSGLRIGDRAHVVGGGPVGCLVGLLGAEAGARITSTAVIVGANRPGVHGIDLLSVMFAELTIVGSRTYQRSDIEAAIELVTSGRLDTRRLISKIFPLDDAVAAIEGLRRREGMKVLIDPGRARAA